MAWEDWLMKRAKCLALALMLATTMSAIAFAPAPFPNRRAMQVPVGRWTVKFTNGVIETCVVRSDRTAAVSEPLRSSPGKAEVKDGAVVITFADDRVERWTARGNRMVVEHWFPTSQYPAGRKVTGIATRLP
jgi:hypothetical protein